MFISDRFVFLELHKTGSSHIRALLGDVLEGELVGKHNQAPEALFDGSRVFLGSIRNPWEWYCSLWAYGCDQRGAVYRRTTQKGESWRSTPLKSFLRLLRPRDAEIWRDTYRDVNDPGAFRAWLALMHDPDFAIDINKGYDRSGLGSGCIDFRCAVWFTALKTER